MTESVRRLSRRRTGIDLVATVAGLVGVAAFVLLGGSAWLLVGVYGLLLGTSTTVVTFCLTRFTGIAVERSEGGDGRVTADPPSFVERARAVVTGEALETDDDVAMDTGWLIGRLENVLVLSLVLAGQYTALSIIFAAKSWVRVEDTSSEDTTYYLAGTLVNFTYSIVLGLLAIRLLGLG